MGVRPGRGVHRWAPRATGSGTNLWTATEGLLGSTNPTLGGRVVIFVDQAAVD